jgi:hypothetical protein
MSRRYGAKTRTVHAVNMDGIIKKINESSFRVADGGQSTSEYEKLIALVMSTV